MAADIVSAMVYLEDGLHLVQLRVWVFTSEHLDNQAPDTPNVRLFGIGGLFNDFRRHPEYRAL